MNLKQGALAAAFVCVAGGAILHQPIYQTFTKEKDVQFRVIDKERVPLKGTNDSEYRVYTKDSDGESHVYKNVDSWVQFKFNSSDVQTDLEVGKSYQAETTGLRFRFTSDYPNIIEVKEIPSIDATVETAKQTIKHNGQKLGN